MTCEKVDFQGHLYEKPYIHHLKVLKKLYKRHLNGTYRFLIRNSDKCLSKLSELVKFHSTQVVLTALSHNFLYF